MSIDSIGPIRTVGAIRTIGVRRAINTIRGVGHRDNNANVLLIRFQEI